jgi:thiol:disulfide interchange protein
MGDSGFGTKGVVAVLIVLAGMLFYRMQFPATTFAADGVDPDWDAAVQRSHDSGQPTVVLFTAKWCPYCRMLESSVLPQSDVQSELQGHFNFYTVDMTNPTEEARDHARKLHVGGYPCLVRFDPNGQETGRNYYMDAQSMMNWLKAGE